MVPLSASSQLIGGTGGHSPAEQTLEGIPTMLKYPQPIHTALGQPRTVKDEAGCLAVAGEYLPSPYPPLGQPGGVQAVGSIVLQ